MRDEEDFSFHAPPRGISDYREMKPATRAKDEAGALWGVFVSLAFVAIFVISSLGLGELIMTWIDRFWKPK